VITNNLYISQFTTTQSRFKHLTQTNFCVATPSHNQFKSKPNLFLQSVTSPELTIEYLDPSIQLQYLFQINIHHTYLTLIIKLKYTYNLGNMIVQLKKIFLLQKV